MSVIKDNSVVEVDFTLTTSDGEVIDSSKNDGPLKYIHGQKRVIPQLEVELTGKSTGDELKFSVNPEDAYGVRDDSLVQLVGKEFFGADFDKIEVGMPLEMAGPNGEAAVVVAVDIREDGILIDGNHPLAGETLHFDVKVLSVRDASKEELDELNKESNCKTGCC